jgi:uncharacterized protein YraI
MEVSMNVRSIVRTAALLCALAAPGVADAATAYAVGGTTNMRAGPGTQYPVVARVVGGSRVNVIGCVAGYSWCDGRVQGVRGWIAGSRLEFPYANRRVLVPQYYAYFGAPVIRFDFGSQGERHRWRDRERWRPDRDRDGRWEIGEDGDPVWRPDDDDNGGGWNPGGGGNDKPPRPVPGCLAVHPIC